MSPGLLLTFLFRISLTTIKFLYSSLIFLAQSKTSFLISCAICSICKTIPFVRSSAFLSKTVLFSLNCANLSLITPNLVSMSLILLSPKRTPICSSTFVSGWVQAFNAYCKAYNFFSWSIEALLAVLSFSIHSSANF